MNLCQDGPDRGRFYQGGTICRVDIRNRDTSRCANFSRGSRNQDTTSNHISLGTCRGYESSER
jgi:hypothetical protein